VSSDDRPPADPVAAALGEERADELALELDEHGLMIIPVHTFDELMRKAAGYDRLEAIARGDDQPAS
jgi:hypothetical protein